MRPSWLMGILLVGSTIFVLPVMSSPAFHSEVAEAQDDNADYQAQQAQQRAADEQQQEEYRQQQAQQRGQEQQGQNEYQREQEEQRHQEEMNRLNSEREEQN
jgi:hypothetical protein